MKIRIVIFKMLLIIALFIAIGVASGYEATYTRKATITKSKDGIVTSGDITDDIIKGVK